MERHDEHDPKEPAREGGEQPADGERPAEDEGPAPEREQPAPERERPAAEQPAPPGDGGPRRIYRSRDDRVLAGVCGGLGRYFGVDPLIFRIATIVLAFVGFTGVLLYLAAALLMPNDPAGPGAAAAAGTAAAGAPGPERSGTNRALTVIAIVVGLIVLGPLLLGAGLVIGGILVPVAVLALAGLAVWWLVSGEGPSGSGRETAQRVALGLGVLLLCLVIAFGGFWAAAAGGEVVVASLIFASGVALLIGAFTGGVRWLILPSLALALPVAFVAAAGIELDGGVGEREYRPGSPADVRDRYELGMGSLVVDLRDVELPAGDREIELDVGIGEALLIVPEDVCVASDADVGMGAVDVFDRDTGGIDVDWQDARSAPSGTPRILVDANVGLGVFEVQHRRYRDRHDRDWFDDDDAARDTRGNFACTDASSAAVAGG